MKNLADTFRKMRVQAATRLLERAGALLQHPDELMWPGQHNCIAPAECAAQLIALALLGREGDPCEEAAHTIEIRFTQAMYAAIADVRFDPGDVESGVVALAEAQRILEAAE